MTVDCASGQGPCPGDVAEPRLVILDKMKIGLDPAARRTAWELVATVRQRGATVLLVTHFLDEAEWLCDRMALPRQARIVSEGTAAELVAAVGDASTVHQRGVRPRLSVPRPRGGWGPHRPRRAGDRDRPWATVGARRSCPGGAGA
jgi:ABC-type multidrug transport system ATPase subunit